MRYNGKRKGAPDSVIRSVRLVRGHRERKGAVKLWAFDLEDLARVLGVKDGRAARRLIGDPGDLEAICRAWAERNGA